MTKPYISVVIPIHNEQEVLSELYTRLTAVLDKIKKPSEIVFVNDGSRDKSEKILTEYHQLRPHQIKVINFNSNFGQHMAIMAGFEKVDGEIIITMDADLQNLPEDIPKLIKAMEKGHDVVGGWRENRQDKLWRKLVSNLHNKFRLKIAPKINMKDEGCMLRAYRRDIVDLMVSSGESSTFIPALALTYANNPTDIPVQHAAREQGTSSYNFYKLIRYNFDLVTNFSLVPLQIFTMIGLLVSSASAVLFIYMVVRRLIIGPEVQGVFTLFAIVFFLIGCCLFGLGILGEYIGRIYQETLNRPRFVIKNYLNTTTKPKAAVKRKSAKPPKTTKTTKTPKTK